MPASCLIAGMARSYKCITAKIQDQRNTTVLLPHTSTRSSTW